MAVYVTGDTHGDIDIPRLKTRWLPGVGGLTRDDYLVVCGDFGLFWSDPLSKASLTWLDWLEACPFTTLWVDGNHENFVLADAQPTHEWHGGQVQADPRWPHVLHLMRGEVYDLPVGDGQVERCFVMGGATSIDREWRIEGRTWWARELPDDAEYERATANLERVGWQVDYVFSHTCPKKVKPAAISWDWRQGELWCDELEGYLQWVDERLDHDRLKTWYFGHFHRDLACDDKHVLLYEQVVPLGEFPQQEP